MNKKPLTPANMRHLIPRLGKEKDIDLAAEFNVSRQYIGQLRDKHGKPAYKPEPPLLHPVPVCFSEGDINDIKNAIKKTGDKHRSVYIRGAVRDKNKGVLGK